MLAPRRLSAERVARLRPDNPERALMDDLVGGMNPQRTYGLLCTAESFRFW